MSKRIISMLLSVIMIVSVLSLASCGDDSGNDLPIGPGNETGDNVLTAPDGSTVTLPKNVTKVVTVSDAAKSMFTALNKADKIVASYGTDEDATSAIVSAKPELVIYDENAKIDVSAITSAGIAAVKLPVADSVATIKNHLSFIGKVMNVSAESIIDSITKSLNTMQLATAGWEKLNVYVELGSGEDGYYTVAPYSYVHELLSSAGGNNIFGADSGLEGFVTVSEADVLAKNPDIILTTGSADDIINREGWSECTAVVNGNVFSIGELVASNEVVSIAQEMNDHINSVMNPSEDDAK